MNGRPIVGATARTYTIPQTAPGNAKFQVLVTIPGVVAKKSVSVRIGKAVPTVALAKKGKALTVRITVASTSRPTGTVIVHAHGTTHKYRLKAAQHGLMTIKMPAGKYKVSVDYRGTSKIARKSTKTKTYSFA
jgi:hypothetical protein